MAADPLEQVLNLVAEGTVSAEEAASILAALDARSGPSGTAGAGDTRKAPPGNESSGDSGFDPKDAADLGGRAAASLRLEVRDGSRQVLNVRLPIAVGRLALDRVPGLSGDQVERVREALNSGMRGPVLEVNDGDNMVRIVLE